MNTTCAVCVPPRAHRRVTGGERDDDDTIEARASVAAMDHDDYLIDRHVRREAERASDVRRPDDDERTSLTVHCGALCVEAARWPLCS